MAPRAAITAIVGDRSRPVPARRGRNPRGDRSSQRAATGGPLRNHEPAHGLTGNARSPPRAPVPDSGLRRNDGFCGGARRRGNPRCRLDVVPCQIEGAPGLALSPSFAHFNCRGGSGTARATNGNGAGRMNGNALAFHLRNHEPRIARRRGHPRPSFRRKPESRVLIVFLKTGGSRTAPTENPPARSPRAFARICGYGAFP